MYGGGMLESNLDANGAKPRLPIWLDQHGNEPHLENPALRHFWGHQARTTNNGGMLPSEMVQWLNGSQEAVVAAYSGLQLKEEGENKGENCSSMLCITTILPPLHHHLLPLICPPLHYYRRQLKWVRQEVAIQGIVTGSGL
ncbi:hypothetical protein Lser_V15G29094 [Lactuca serriola]